MLDWLDAALVLNAADKRPILQRPIFSRSVSSSIIALLCNTRYQNIPHGLRIEGEIVASGRPWRPDRRVLRIPIPQALQRPVKRPEHLRHTSPPGESVHWILTRQLKRSMEYSSSNLNCAGIGKSRTACVSWRISRGTKTGILCATLRVQRLLHDPAQPLKATAELVQCPPPSVASATNNQWLTSQSP